MSCARTQHSEIFKYFMIFFLFRTKYAINLPSFINFHVNLMLSPALAPYNKMFNMDSECKLLQEITQF